MTGRTASVLYKGHDRVYDFGVDRDLKFQLVAEGPAVGIKMPAKNGEGDKSQYQRNDPPGSFFATVTLLLQPFIHLYIGPLAVSYQQHMLGILAIDPHRRRRDHEQRITRYRLEYYIPGRILF